MYQVKVPDKDIDKVLNEIAEAADQGTRWRGMTYEQGVEAGIRWVLGETSDNPMAD